MTGRAHFYGLVAYGILITETQSVLGPVGVRDVSREVITHAILCAANGQMLPESSDELYAVDTGPPEKLSISFETYRHILQSGTVPRACIADDVRAIVSSQCSRPIDRTMASAIACKLFSPVYDTTNDHILLTPRHIRLGLEPRANDKHVYSDDPIYASEPEAIDVLVLAVGRRRSPPRNVYWVQARMMHRKIITPPTFYQYGFAVTDAAYRSAKNNRILTESRPLAQCPPQPPHQKPRTYQLGPADQVAPNHRFALQNGEIVLHVTQVGPGVGLVKAVRVNRE